MTALGLKSEKPELKANKDEPRVRCGAEEAGAGGADRVPAVMDRQRRKRHATRKRIRMRILGVRIVTGYQVKRWQNSMVVQKAEYRGEARGLGLTRRKQRCKQTMKGGGVIPEQVGGTRK